MMHHGQSNRNDFLFEETPASSWYPPDEDSEDQRPPYYADVNNDTGSDTRQEKSPSTQPSFVYEGTRPVPSNVKQKNIVLFGETGVGKSSVINLIAGQEVADTSPNSKGCTFQSTEYSFTAGELQLRIYDTVGLEEPDIGVNTFFGAIEKAHQLVTSLNAAGGIDLLLFCIRAGRITCAMQRTYRLFVEFLCEEQVPLALVVTHLENNDEMEDWWVNNEQALKDYGIAPVAHACITAAPERLTQYTEKRAQSRRALEDLLRNTLSSASSPYSQDVRSWFKRLAAWLHTLLKRPMSLKAQRKQLVKSLITRCGLRDEEAKKFAEMLAKG